MRLDLKKIRLFPAACIGLGALLCLDATAQTWTGSGADNNITTGANWSTGVQPEPNENVLFGPTSRVEPFFNFAGGARDRLGDVTFATTAPTYTVQGDGTKSLRLRNIYNDSENLQIFDVDLIFLNKTTVLAGAPIDFRGNIEAHTGNNELEFTGSSTITLSGDNQLDPNLNLFLDGGITLDVSGTTQSFNSITVTGDAFIDFGFDANLNLNNITVAAGGSLNIVNWDAESSFVVEAQPDEGTQGRIYIDGTETHWDVDQETGITPVPEPRVYGAAFMAIAFGFLYVYRRRRGGVTRDPAEAATRD